MMVRVRAKVRVRLKVKLRIRVTVMMTVRVRVKVRVKVSEGEVERKSGGEETEGNNEGKVRVIKVNFWYLLWHYFLQTGRPIHHQTNS